MAASLLLTQVLRLLWRFVDLGVGFFSSSRARINFCSLCKPTVPVTFPVTHFLDSSNSFLPNGHSDHRQRGRKGCRIMVHKRDQQMPLPSKCLQYIGRQDNKLDKEYGESAM